MDISSVTGASFHRSVTPTRSGSDRHISKENVTTTRADDNQDQIAVQEKQAQRNIENQTENTKENQRENQRRLDGRLFTLEQTGKELSGQELDQNRSRYIRERVNEAYTPANRTYENSQQNQSAVSEDKSFEAIDIVV